MKKERIPLKGGAEWDALTKARKYYVYLQSAGVVKSIKKQYNKRLRKHLKQFDKNDVKYRDGDNTYNNFKKSLTNSAILVIITI